MPHFVPLYYIDSYIWFPSKQEIVRNNSFPPDSILSQIILIWLLWEGIYVGPQIGMNPIHTAMGTPRFGIMTYPYPYRFGDPHTNMRSPFWMPFQFGDKTLKSQIGMNPIPLLVSDWTIPKPIRGSPFWYGDSGIPVLVWGSPNRFGDSFDAHPPFRFGDPRFGMGIRGSPFWFGYPRIGLGIHLMHIPILLWGSPFWYGDSGIPVLVWGSPNRFGDSFDTHPHFILGIPVLICGFGDPRFGLGIPKSVRGYPNQFGDSCNAHPHFGMGIPEQIRGSPNRYGDPQTKMGCPRIDSKS
jgi:hypothetical protein